MKECTDRADLNNTGVYFLFGKDEPGKEKVYIGEAETVLKRLFQHLTQKDFWNEVIVFISKDENLNKAHIKYLENRLYEIAISAKRYSVENSVVPTQSSISESDKAEMEEFLENIKLLVNSLGHKVFEEKREFKVTLLDSKNYFQIKAARGADAQGLPTSDGFVVLKGSKFASSTVDSFPLSLNKLRQQIIDQGLLVNSNNNLELSEDFIFGSPSTAAAVVMGRNANGLLEWKLLNGTTLKMHETPLDSGKEPVIEADKFSPQSLN